MATVWLLASTVIALAYLSISASVVQQVLRMEERWRDNPLAVATAAIFGSCGVGHLLHVASGLSDHDDMVGGPLFGALVAWDVVTAGVGLWYWSLRRLFPGLRTGGSLFQGRGERETQHLATAFDALPHPVFVFDVERDETGDPRRLKVRFASAAARRIRDQELEDVQGRYAEDAFPGAGSSGLFDAYLQVARSGQPLHRLAEVATGVARGAWDITAVPWEGGVLVHASDVSQRVREERRRERTERMLRQAQQLAGIGSWHWDLVRGELFCSAATRDLFGLPEDGEVEIGAMNAAVHPDDRVEVDRCIEAALSGGGPFRMEHRIVRGDGAVRWVSATGEVEREHDEPVMVWGTVTDITERVAREAELVRAAERDPLTGLPNRRAWDAALAEALDARRERGEPGVVVLLDLDHFKSYNDTHGHVAGDELLRAVGRAWRSRLRSPDLVARLGGEEFGVLLRGCSPRAGRRVAEELRGAVPLGVTTSAGVTALLPADDAVQAVRRADAALYAAKTGGRDRVEVLDPFQPDVLV